MPQPLSTEEAVRPFSVSHGSVLRIALPMILAYLSVPLVGIIDTAVIGQLGDAALLGGIAVGAIVLDIVFTTFNFLRAGTTGLTAQALGAGRTAETTAVLGRALFVAVLCGLAIVMLQWPMIEAGSRLMGASPPVDAAMRRYLGIRIWASPFGVANFVLLGWLLGLGRSVTVLVIQTTFAALNVVLSVYFVLWLRWDVAGVAWASVLAEALTVALQVPIVLRIAPAAGWPSGPKLFERTGFVRLLGVNRDIMIRSFCLFFAFAFFTRQGARFGAVPLAANALLMHFFVLSGYFLDGFATAAEQLAGRAVGARFRPAFDQVVRLTTGWGLAIAVPVSLIYFLAGPAIIDVLTTSPEVRAAAQTYLVWAALTPLAGVVAFQMDGIFIGATWSRDMRNMMLLSLLIFLLACTVLIRALGNHGLWIALLIFLGARSAAFAWRMRQLLPATFPKPDVTP